MSKFVGVSVSHGSLDKAIKALTSQRNLEEIGRVAVKEMRISLERGISPVRGERRMASYSASYARAIKNGLLEVEKKVRPVNLILSGQMVRAIEYKADNGKLEVGIWDSEMAQLAGYHQDGTNKMPARRFIPTLNSEFLTVTIDRALINKLKDIINRSIR